MITGGALLLLTIVAVLAFTLPRRPRFVVVWQLRADAPSAVRALRGTLGRVHLESSVLAERLHDEAAAAKSVGKRWRARTLAREAGTVRLRADALEQRYTDALEHRYAIPGLRSV